MPYSRKNVKVAIVYKFLPQWRKSFFERLRTKLSEYDITLDLYYGKLNNEDSLRNDEVKLDWGKFRENKVIKIFNKDIYWQPVFNEVKNYDLVIVEQATKLLLNYLLLIFRGIFNYKVAFWGHGRSMQIDEHSLTNKIGRLFIKKPNWWFAYTKGVYDYLVKYGVNCNNITIVQNTLDTSELYLTKQLVNSSLTYEIKKKYKILSGNIAVFCGGLVKIKEIPFLIEACDFIRKKIIDFEIIIMGSGPYKTEVESWASKNSWVHYVGPKFGIEKAALLNIAQVLLVPGLLGLVVIDSFIFETPIITTTVNYPAKSPEIEYFKENYNGMCSDYNPMAYTNCVVSVLKNQVLLKKLQNGCCHDAKKYTIENMIDKFSDGINMVLRDII